MTHVVQRQFQILIGGDFKKRYLPNEQGKKAPAGGRGGFHAKEKGKYVHKLKEHAGVKKTN